MVWNTITRPHWLGVKPNANGWLEARREVADRETGLGRFLCSIDDEGLLGVLEWLDGRDLANVVRVSKYLYVFGCHEPLWREIALARWSEVGERFEFKGTWRSTVLKQAHERPFDNVGVILSNALYLPHQYAHTEIHPNWLKLDNVLRKRASDLSVQDFIRDFEAKECRRPLLITGALDSWKAFERWGTSFEEVAKKHGEQKFRVGPVDMGLNDFLRYVRLCESDENPLYLFDCKFASKVKELGNDFDVPKYFRNSEEHPYRDLLSAMGEDRRPDYRWLIIGGAKSGSKWHVDPNKTHAWNACVSGSKLWMLFPPYITPPGVMPSPDGTEVAQPVSLMEWFVNYYSQALELKPVQFIARARDLVFVPAGWWHCVINLETCVAVTQNYISDTNLFTALEMMKNHPELVSGLPEDRPRSALYGEFYGVLQAKHSALLTRLQTEEDKLLQNQLAKKRATQGLRNIEWGAIKKSRLVPSADQQAQSPLSTFSFSFNLFS